MTTEEDLLQEDMLDEPVEPYDQYAHRPPRRAHHKILQVLLVRPYVRPHVLPAG